MSVEVVQEFGRKELNNYTEKNYTSFWQKFPLFPSTVDLFLPFASAFTRTILSHPEDGVSVFCRNDWGTLGYTVCNYLSDEQEFGRKELNNYTEKIYTSFWQKFPPFPSTVDLFLPFALALPEPY
jgi:hypothetical protein